MCELLQGILCKLRMIDTVTGENRHSVLHVAPTVAAAKQLDMKGLRQHAESRFIPQGVHDSTEFFQRTPAQTRLSSAMRFFPSKEGDDGRHASTNHQRASLSSISTADESVYAPPPPDAVGAKKKSSITLKRSSRIDVQPAGSTRRSVHVNFRAARESQSQSESKSESVSRSASTESSEDDDDDGDEYNVYGGDQNAPVNTVRMTRNLIHVGHAILWCFCCYVISNNHD